jgi:proton-dependent oligopeptide transporter, POT family
MVTYMNKVESLKQPPVFNLAFYTTMCERFGFYILSFLVVLYAKGEFGLSDVDAFGLYVIFTALVYLTTAFGGYLADNVFGIRRCLISGLVLESLGFILLALPQRSLFPFALACIIVGVGLFKTAPTHLLGRSYRENDPRIDSGFTLYYMAINIGTVISAFGIGFVQRYYGWHVSFLVGAIGIACGLIFYAFMKKPAQVIDSQVGKVSLGNLKWVFMLLGIFVGIVLSGYLVSHSTIAYMFYALAAVGLLVYFIYEIARSPKKEKGKIIACLLLIMMGFIFYVLYNQAYTSFVLFINRSVDRHLFGIEIPTSTFFALNPGWVVILGPILAWLYNYLGKKGKDISVTVKFSIGLLITTLCFFVLRISGYFAGADGMVSPLWIVLVYFFYTLGEMLVGALGVAMVTHIAPKRMYGVMMGTWFFWGMSLSAIAAGKIANIASIPDTLTDHVAILNVYNHAFLEIGIFSIIIALASFALGPCIKRLEARGDDAVES